jgi:uncharacterized surface anchored protein
MRILLLGVALVITSMAQVERASVVRTVSDKTGAVVAGVDIKVTHEATNTTWSLRTDESGNYAAPNLVPGSYIFPALH